MARDPHDEPDAGPGADPAADPGDDATTYEGDSSFEAAQQLLQAAVAEFRGSGAPRSSHPDDDVDAAGHRRWRRRVVVDDLADPASWSAPALADDPAATDERRAEALTAAAFTEAETAASTAAESTAATPVASDASDASVDADVGVSPAVSVDADVDAAPAVSVDADVDAPLAFDPLDAPVDPPDAAPRDAHARRRGRRRAGTAAAASIAAADTTGVAADQSGDLDDLAGTVYEPRVPRRRRHGTARPQTVASPTADYVLTSAEPTLGADETLAAPAPAKSGRARRVLVVGLAAVVAIAAITFALTTGGSDDQVASPPAEVAPRLAFDPVATPEGVTVTRVWKLSGDDGDTFTGRLAFRNPSTAAVTTTFTETIPKSLASSVAAITFDPQPVVIKADPVVQYTVTVEPSASFVASYTVAVPAAGATRERLLKWADDLRVELGTATTSTLPPAPTTIAPPTTAPAATTRGGARSGGGGGGGATPTTAAPAPAPTVAPPPPTTVAPPPPVFAGSIEIVVRTLNGASGTYNFSNGVSIVVGENSTGSSGPLAVDPGLYPATLLNGNVVNIDCTDRDAGPFADRSTVSPPSATFNVQPGEAVSCTWRVDSPST